MPKTISDPSNTTNQNIVREIRERINALPLNCPLWDDSDIGEYRKSVEEILEDYERSSS